MKVEIKKVKKERQGGFYKVELMDGSLSIGQYSLSTKKWYLCGNEIAFNDNLFKKIHENPILFENEELKPEFEPFELSLTIESKGELQELWHKMNMCISRFKDFNGYGIGEYQYSFNSNDKQISSIIWAKLNEIMKGRNIKP